MSSGLPPNPVGGAIFAVLALVCVVGSVGVEVEATWDRNALLGVFSSLLMTLGIAFIYEAVALIWRLWPSLSESADLAYLATPVLWLSLYALVNLADGALSLHFTRTKGHWNWSTAVVGLASFAVGSVLTVVFRWVP